MRRALAITVLALAAAVPAAADPPPPGIYDAGTDGKALYGGNCATCHGSNGQGRTSAPLRGVGNRPGLGPSLRGAGALAADFYLRTGYMPLASPSAEPKRSRVLFTDRQLDALIAYVASLGNGPPVPRPRPERGSVATGMRSFTQHCAGCHQIVGEGGYVTDARVPPLEDSTATQIAEAVRIGPYLMPRFSKRQIPDAELNSIIRYVLYAKHPKDDGGWSLGHLGPMPEGLVTWLIAAVVLVGVCLVIGKRATQ